jgi:hypothetical protein
LAATMGMALEAVTTRHSLQLWQLSGRLYIAARQGCVYVGGPPIGWDPWLWWPDMETVWLPRWHTAGYPGLMLPLWMVIVPMAEATIVAFRAGGRRLASGECAACGYDRTGLVARAVCPECGNAPKTMGGHSRP